MKTLIRDNLDNMIAQLDNEIENLLNTKRNLVMAKELIDAAFAQSAPIQIKESRETVEEVRKVRKPMGPKRYSWDDIREVLKQMHPDMLTVTQIAEVSGIPRSIVSYHTSTNKRLLRREYVQKANKLHWEYKMTLKNPPYASKVAQSVNELEDHRPVVAIDRIV